METPSWFAGGLEQICLGIPKVGAHSSRGKGLESGGSTLIFPVVCN